MFFYVSLEQRKINGALIIAPKGVINTWYEQEIPLHLADHVNYKCVLWQALINWKQQKKLNTLFETGEDLHILIMNVEALSTTKGTKFAYKFISSHKTLMVVDESTTIKNPKAKRTKNITKLSKSNMFPKFPNLVLRLITLFSLKESIGGLVT